MRKAERAIFFLVFMPSRGGINSVVSEAVALGLKDTSLNVVGAISDTQAMWGYEPSQTLPDGKELPSWSPHTFKQGGVSVVRATALTDREIGRAVGDFTSSETLTLGRAIIHDKVLVIDPLDPENCVVAFGSHNLGYKASYSNDENLVMVQGHAGAGPRPTRRTSSTSTITTASAPSRPSSPPRRGGAMRRARRTRGGTDFSRRAMRGRGGRRAGSRLISTARPAASGRWW